MSTEFTTPSTSPVTWRDVPPSEQMAWTKAFAELPPFPVNMISRWALASAAGGSDPITFPRFVGYAITWHALGFTALEWRSLMLSLSYLAVQYPAQLEQSPLVGGTDFTIAVLARAIEPVSWLPWLDSVRDGVSTVTATRKMLDRSRGRTSFVAPEN
jgi:hypothetical protein